MAAIVTLGASLTLPSAVATPTRLPAAVATSTTTSAAAAPPPPAAQPPAPAVPPEIPDPPVGPAERLEPSTSCDLEEADLVSGEPIMIYGTPGPDVITGTPGNDSICGLGGDDVIDGGQGNDTIDAGDGNNRVTGGDGDDQLSTEGLGGDWMDGGPGDDGVFGGAGDDELHGGPGRDHLVGASGHDTLFGESGNDVVQGDSGNDALWGGDGNDLLHGGDGTSFLAPSIAEVLLDPPKPVHDLVSGDAGFDVCVRWSPTCEEGASPRRPGGVLGVIRDAPAAPQRITVDDIYPGVTAVIDTNGGIDHWNIDIAVALAAILRTEHDVFAATPVTITGLLTAPPIRGGQLTLTYRQERIEGSPEEDLRIHTFDEASRSWTPVLGAQVVDAARNTITAPLTGLGTYAVLKVP